MKIIFVILVLCVTCFLFPDLTSAAQIAEDFKEFSAISVDLFLKELEALTPPSYVLAENFPQDKVKVFDDFIAFCSLLEQRQVEIEKELDNISQYDIEYATTIKTIKFALSHNYCLPQIVKARFAYVSFISYEDFLDAVSLACAFIYSPIIIYKSPIHAYFFIKHTLEPLHHALKTETYDAYHFDANEFIDFYENKKSQLIRYYEAHSKPTIPMIGYRSAPSFPESQRLLDVYANTFWNVQKGELYTAYDSITVYGVFTYQPNRFKRPYYFDVDEERYRWFLFFQKELRCAGHIDFAEKVLQTEIDHYRELIVWQLQGRSYLTKKTYNEDILTLPRLKRLLKMEYDVLRQDRVLEENLEKIAGILREMDDEVNAFIPPERSRGVLLLPWIDREDLDRRLGIRP